MNKKKLAFEDRKTQKLKGVQVVIKISFISLHTVKIFKEDILFHNFCKKIKKFN